MEAIMESRSDREIATWFFISLVFGAPLFLLVGIMALLVGAYFI
jgi:uncharacterized protein with PQ loop repeat